ncbi:DUF4326 domain-containing protein [Rhodovarius lipocyclicus]|uniref:DUF4326 domain-containing protein n=1 Tax=Rhodovarius lipocyclicus TaxID=268410 RepID=UPI0013576C7A|nr:DUF4326 domain-containing protein [Rhodovarius lipocyclicus]
MTAQPDTGRVPVRVQLKRLKGWRMPPGTIAVTRPGPWGNYAGPTARHYREDVAGMSNADRAFFFDRLKEIRGKNLACWCRLDQECHADVLLELANAPEIGGADDRPA